MSSKKHIQRIAFVGHDNSGSRHILSAILDAFPHVTPMVVVAGGLYYGHSTFTSILRMARESSIRFCAARAVEMLRYRLRGETIPRLCDARGVDWFATTDINASHCTDRLRKFAPDLIVSLYTMQLYRRPILDIPPLGTINAHPS
ncbi:MAG TPA: hypothetical protein VKE42_04720, partial [Candidatus Cybelea sp.]|nr:hypothetical protein [Candidatus Cybelea sp.]